MSHLLWKYYWENDVDRFRCLLAPAGRHSQSNHRTSAIEVEGISPRAVKPRRTSGYIAAGKDSPTILGRSEVNSRDHAGLTLLMRAASSTDPSAIKFVQALLNNHSIDIYAQDHESGWNALHRALYSGNISIARLILNKERQYLTSHDLSSVNKVGMLIRTKDHEGKSPFDLYNSSIATRNLQYDDSGSISESDDSEDDLSDTETRITPTSNPRAYGDEFYVFGSNKNLSLGVGDSDDRQFPERIQLRRPEKLIFKDYERYCADLKLVMPDGPLTLEDIPNLVRDRPIIIQDVVMSKLHSAVLTSDSTSNLYLCGVGRGGRLGFGNEDTHFKFSPIQGPLFDKKITQVALGLNHTLAVTGNGELWSWGLNTDNQLGYSLPSTKVGDEPMSMTPRQVFGALKKELVVSVAASSISSVAATASSLYCWGRNKGQLALMDSASRSMDFQHTPRKVASSLLSAPIKMVSAIDKATSCLLTNHTVIVFTNYGYTKLELPQIPDVFTNHNIMVSCSNRYKNGRKDIAYITSGGTTLAVLTKSGDLFTMQINEKDELAQPDVSTTNPTKMKGALTHPQCIWDSRKDGVVSVNVGEHGSVIICTESGAVWKRVKRSKGKTSAFAESSDAKAKGFKFERVPYVTNCVGVRSSTFGAFAAFRENNRAMSGIKIQSATLTADIGSLLSLETFQAAGATNHGLGIVDEIQRSIDIETDLLNWLKVTSHDSMDMELRTSSDPDIRIPVHGWAMGARSTVLRAAFSEFRKKGICHTSNFFTLGKMGKRTVLTFLNIDVYTLLAVVVYIYKDETISVWNYTREPSLAYRHRQVRIELMKVATALNMPQLETIARTQGSKGTSMAHDMQEAIKDPLFFEDGDVILELDGTMIYTHRELMCRRCPWFDVIFHGRSGGGWLTGRRSTLGPEDKIRLDLKHMNSDIFQYVIAHIYGDVGTELFDEVAAVNVDDFSEVLFFILGAANELMLDRLSQICQFTIAKFVTPRNISTLLNEISPCAVTDFKRAGLEYVCLQLENMLENQFLDDLDEDLLQELDEVTRDNQLSLFPFARSGRADLLLREKYPQLAVELDEERQIRIKELAYKAALKQDEKKLSSSYKMRASILDLASPSPTAERSHRKATVNRSESFSPILRPKSSVADMIFDMDEEVALLVTGQISLNERPKPDQEPMMMLPKVWQQSKGKVKAVSSPLGVDPMLGSTSSEINTTSRMHTKEGVKPPWASATLQTSKLDLKDIMSEGTSKSALSAGLTARKRQEPSISKPQTMKVSQKERKKQLQQLVETQAAEQEKQYTPWQRVEDGKTTPWKATAPVFKPSLKDTMSSETAAQSAMNTTAKPLVASEARTKPICQRTASPDTRFPGQDRKNSSPAVPSASGSHQRQKPKPLVPHSKTYFTPAPKLAEELGASMADIIGQQRREQEMVKEATAKRSLQEIQQEQEFQQWWDQESRRTQEEEARRQLTAKKQDGNAGQRGRRGRGVKPRAAEGGNRLEKTESGIANRGRGGPTSRGGGSSNRGKGIRGRDRKATTSPA